MHDNIFAQSLLKAIRTPKYFQIVPIIVEVEESVPFDPIISKVLNTLQLPVDKIIPYMNMFSLRVPTYLLPDIAAIDNVKKIYLNREHYALEIPFNIFDPLGLFRPMESPLDAIKALRDRIFGTQNGWIPTTEALKVTRVYDLHDRGIKGEGIKLFVLDTGTDLAHPQLRTRIRGAYTQTLGSPEDGNGHGSHCASIAAGAYWEHPITKLKMIGVAPECDLYSIKVLTDIGSGDTASIMRAIEQAVSMGADVISMSLGSEGSEDEEDDPMVKMINKLGETHPKVIFCIANGNSGPEPKTVGIPAIADNCISVGAYDVLKQDVAWFSSRGPTTQLGKTRPHILAPGVDIYSGLTLGSILDYVDKMPSQASPLSGTSMATPHLAGIMALWKQIMPDLTVQDVINIFKVMSGRRQDNDRGYGLVNATWILNIT